MKPFCIETSWISAGSGSRSFDRADEATLGSLSIRVHGRCFTTGRDRVTGERQDRLRLAAYPVARWLCWNWWRLLHEAHRRDCRSDLAWMDGHSMAGIGGGWLWPNITIAFDGRGVRIETWPSSPTPTEPFTHLASDEARVSAEAFEAETARFVRRVLERLDSQGIRDTPVHAAWKEISSARNDPEIARYRRLEASLGYELDQADAEVVAQFDRDRERYGRDAMTEVAADDPCSAQQPLPGRALVEAAREFGVPFDRDNAAHLDGAAQAEEDTDSQAWTRGERAAQRLREQERLGSAPLGNARLSALCGIGNDAVSGTGRFARLAFSLNGEIGSDRMVLRSGWAAGRRFELARLLGDHVLWNGEEPLRPATRSRTFRQRLQRAFAAELLCPFEALRDFVGKDDSEEAREAAAVHFQVSPRTVTTILVNKGFLPRGSLPASSG